MRSFVTTILICALTIGIYAQSITLTLVKPPCNGDGEVNIELNNFTFPAYVNYYYDNIARTDTVMSSPISITDFDGGWFSAYVASSGIAVSARENFPNPFDVNFETVQGVCPQLGQATAIMTNGQSPYTITWHNQETDAVVGQSNPISLSNGAYYAIIVDNRGCIVNTKNPKQDSLYLYMYAQPGFTYEVETQIANCTNGSAKVVNIVGGVGPFTYEWSDGTNADEIVGRSAGYYRVNVTDSQGCSLFKEEISIRQSKEIKVEFVTKPETCNDVDGKIQAFPVGGKPPYQYQWVNFPNNTTNTLSSIPSNNYSIFVIDADGCTGQGYTYFPSISPVYAQISQQTPASCNQYDGAATIVPYGGKTPYTIIWMHDNSQNFTASNLGEGTYTFEVTDDNGCKRVGNVYIQSNPNLGVSLYTTNPTCDDANGKIVTNVNGGNPPYTYNWSNGSTSSNASFLSKGYYTVTISDASGCSKVKGIQLYSFSPLKLNFAVDNSSCLYNADGKISTHIIGGTTPYTYTWSNGQNIADITNLKTGKYYVTVKDANGCIGTDMVFVDYDHTNNSCYCTVQGRVYVDTDGDCIIDNNEVGVHNIQLGIDNVGYTYTDVNGQYSFNLPIGSFRLSETVKNQYPLAACAPAFYNFTTNSGTNCIIEYNFAHTINPLHDISIQLWNKDKPVAGYEYNQQLIITNLGTVDEPSTIGLHHTDPQLPLINVSAGMLITTDVDQYSTANLPILKPGQSQTIDLNHPVASTIPLGTELIFYDSCAYTTPINNWLTDYSPANNVIFKRDVVVGSFDPNFIEVLPQGSGEQGYISKETKELSYMVHFQNEGTYYARRIEVVVDIDPNIDIKTIVPVTSTHIPTSITINNNRQLVYTYENIKLQPKIWNEAASQGMFSFMCRLKNGIAEGTIISNKADIFFDFNEAVPTNLTTNTIERISRINNYYSQKNIEIYPNPSIDEISIKIQNDEYDTEADYRFEVYDVNGKFIIYTSRKTLNIAKLANGMYLVKCKTKKGTYNGKFIKSE
jgi:hypothetical protein